MPLKYSRHLLVDLQRDAKRSQKMDHPQVPQLARPAALEQCVGFDYSNGFDEEAPVAEYRVTVIASVFSNQLLEEGDEELLYGGWEDHAGELTMAVAEELGASRGRHAVISR